MTKFRSDRDVRTLTIPAGLFDLPFLGLASRDTRGENCKQNRRRHNSTGFQARHIWPPI